MYDLQNVYPLDRKGMKKRNKKKKPENFGAQMSKPDISDKRLILPLAFMIEVVEFRIARYLGQLRCRPI